MRKLLLIGTVLVGAALAAPAQAMNVEEIGDPDTRFAIRCAATFIATAGMAEEAQKFDVVALVSKMNRNIMDEYSRFSALAPDEVTAVGSDWIGKMQEMKPEKRKSFVEACMARFE